MKGIIALILFITLIVLIIYNPIKVQSESQPSIFEQDLHYIFSDISKNSIISFESFVSDKYILLNTRLLTTPRILTREEQDTSLIILNIEAPIPETYSNYRIIKTKESDSLKLLLISKI